MRRPNSDGCTGWFDGYWRDCCEEHDVLYEQGGDRSERYFADLLLRECVFERIKSRTESPLLGSIISWLMFLGVRVMGSSWCLPLYLWPRWRRQARWGYGKDSWEV